RDHSWLGFGFLAYLNNLCDSFLTDLCICSRSDLLHELVNCVHPKVFGCFPYELVSQFRPWADSSARLFKPPIFLPVVRYEDDRSSGCFGLGNELSPKDQIPILPIR